MIKSSYLIPFIMASYFSGPESAVPRQNIFRPNINKNNNNSAPDCTKTKP